MSKARKYALMGAVRGLAESIPQVAARKESERLEAARAAERRMLLEEERAYRRGEEERIYQRSTEDRAAENERMRAEKLEDYGTLRADKEKDAEAAHKRQVAVAEIYSNRGGTPTEPQPRVVENITTGEQMDLAPGEPLPPGYRETRFGSRYAPSPTRTRQPSNNRGSTATNRTSDRAPYDPNKKQDWLGSKIGG